jgi:hypothetical protein
VGFVRPNVFELCVPNQRFLEYVRFTDFLHRKSDARDLHSVHWVHHSAVALRAQRASVRRTAARANRFAHGIHRVRSLVGAFFHTEPAGTCASQGAHMPLPLASLRLSHDCGFFSLAIPQSRAYKSPPPSSPPPRALPPRDCPILRPRAGLPLSRACDSPFAMSFGTTLRTRFPSSSRHAVGGCMSASRPLKRPSACSLVWSHISMLLNTHAA